MRRVFGLFVAASLPVMGCAAAPNAVEPLGILSHGSAGGVAEQNDVAFRPAGSQIWQPLHDRGDSRRGRDTGFNGRSRRGGDFKSYGRWGGHGDYWYGDYGFPIVDAVAIAVPWYGGLGMPWPNLINAPLLYGGLAGPWMGVGP